MTTIINFAADRARALFRAFSRLFQGDEVNQERMAAAKTFVDSILNKYKVVVFSKTYCPYCTKAKDALSSFKLNSDDYHVIELDERSDGNDIQDYLYSITGARSVPRVFIDGKFFGGGDDTVAAKSNGLLEKKLSEVGVL